MALNKTGSPTKLTVLKQSAFEVDLNVLASVISDKYPEKKLSINDLHEVLKTLGVTDYKAEDMQELAGRLHAVGITVIGNV